MSWRQWFIWPLDVAWATGETFKPLQTSVSWVDVTYAGY